MLRIKFMSDSCGIALRWISQSTLKEKKTEKLNIGSGNGLVPSGNKPLPQLSLTQIYVTISMS